jgi:hypothetical protein
VPTFDERPQFWNDFNALTPQQQATFLTAVRRFVADLRRGQFRAGLRVKRVQGTDGIWELTWAPDGRATFEYGKEVRPGKQHVIWRRIGTHDVFRAP